MNPLGDLDIFLIKTLVPGMFLCKFYVTLFILYKKVSLYAYNVPVALIRVGSIYLWRF